MNLIQVNLVYSKISTRFLTCIYDTLYRRSPWYRGEFCGDNRFELTRVILCSFLNVLAGHTFCFTVPYPYDSFPMCSVPFCCIKKGGIRSVCHRNYAVYIFIFGIEYTIAAPRYRSYSNCRHHQISNFVVSSATGTKGILCFKE